MDNPSARGAIAATFRGYCSELFVYGKCNRRDHGCSLDHSSAGQERCIQSSNLLMRRELVAHSQLPPWNAMKPNQIRCRYASSINLNLAFQPAS